MVIFISALWWCVISLYSKHSSLLIWGAMSRAPQKLVERISSYISHVYIYKKQIFTPGHKKHQEKYSHIKVIFLEFVLQVSVDVSSQCVKLLAFWHSLGSLYLYYIQVQRANRNTLVSKANYMIALYITLRRLVLILLMRSF